MSHDSLSRKDLLVSTLAALAASAPGQGPAKPEGGISESDLQAIERLVGLEFTEEERKAALAEIRGEAKAFEAVRAALPAIPPAPAVGMIPTGGGSRPGEVRARPSRPRASAFTDPENLLFLPITELEAQLRAGRTTSVALTRLALARLQRFDPQLLCVVSLMEARAMAAARAADAERKSGRVRGPLHGIPYGLKDLFSAKGAPTTWGAAPYRSQVIETDAAVVERLDAAGAILVAKLTSGALAMGDVWFGGTTKNPWNLEQGSSGSSAGSASAVAAGCVPFAIGTETYGSITSPALRCRVTGFRPTFGRISRYGAMELSYSMDKVGPLCRSAEDAALIFAALAGYDPRDLATVDRPFQFPQRVDYRKLRIGYVGPAADLEADPAIAHLRKLGANVTAKTFTSVPSGIFSIIDVESSSAFESLTRSGKVRELKNSAWPGTFRAARYIPAVEYLQMQRLRALAVRRFEEEWRDLDLLLMPGFGATIAHTNFGGHPQVILPWGDDGKGGSRAKSLVARLYADDLLLTVARDLQNAFDYHRRRPSGFASS